MRKRKNPVSVLALKLLKYIRKVRVGTDKLMDIEPQIIDLIHARCMEGGAVDGGMISTVFSLGDSRPPYLPRNLNFGEQKQVFFHLLLTLLEEKRIVLSPPMLHLDNEPHHCLIADGYSKNDAKRKADVVQSLDEQFKFPVWDITHEDQIDYMKKAFPPDATSIDDLELNLWWHTGKCPLIGWIDRKTGVLYPG